MTDEPKTSEQPSGHLRWSTKRNGLPRPSPVLQQMWYLTEYRGTSVEQAEEWRDVPVVSEPL